MGWLDSVGNWLTGGNATANLNPQGANYGTTNSYLKNALGNVNQSPLNFGQANAVNQQQSNLAQQLQGVSTGAQKGAGEMAVDRQVGQQSAAQQALARMAHGSNAALAARQAARTTGDIGAQGAGMAAQSALTDQANARNQLAGVLGQQQQGAYQQQGLNLNQYQAQNQAAQGYLQQLMGQDQNQYNNQLAKNQLNMQDQGHLGQLINAAGQVGMTYATGGFGGGALLGAAPGGK